MDMPDVNYKVTQQKWEELQLKTVQGKPPLQNMMINKFRLKKKQKTKNYSLKDDEPLAWDRRPSMQTTQVLEYRVCNIHKYLPCPFRVVPNKTSRISNPLPDHSFVC
jgi:hypothetical protein